MVLTSESKLGTSTHTPVEKMIQRKPERGRKGGDWGKGRDRGKRGDWGKGEDRGKGGDWRKGGDQGKGGDWRKEEGETDKGCMKPTQACT